MVKLDMQTQQPDFFEIIPQSNALYMLKRFTKVAGLNTSLISLKSGKSAPLPYPRIYEQFYCRIDSENITAAKNYFLKNVHKNRPMFFTTPSGLNYMGFAVNFKNKPVALLMLEPFFYSLKKPSDDFFIMQAQNNSFDLDSFISAVDSVPVLVKNALNRIADNCTNFASLLTNILESRTDADTSKRKLKTADTMLELISYAADKFLTQPRLTKEITELLYRISKSFEIDVTLICRNFKTKEGKPVLKTYWCHGKDEFFNSLQQLTLDGIFYKEDFGRNYENLKHGQQVFGSSDMFIGKLKSVLDEGKVKTVLVTPIFSAGLLWGFIFFESITSKKGFSSVELQTLEHIADIIGAAIRRDRYITLINKNRKKYRLVSENMSDVIWMMDNGLNITYVSSNCEKLLGYTPRELASLTLASIIKTNEYEYVKEKIKNMFSQAGRDKHFSDSIEIEQIRKDKSLVWTEVKFSFVYDKNNKPVALIGAMRDISERKQNRKLIYESKEKAEVNKEFSTKFITNISNKLTPQLLRLLELSKKMQHNDLDAGLKETAADIRENTEDLIFLMDGISSITEFETNQKVLSFEEFNLDELLQEIIKKIKTKEVMYKYSNDLPKMFKGDAFNIYRLLCGIINCASGKIIVISAKTAESKRAGLYGLEFDVKCEGRKLPADRQKEISSILNEANLLTMENLNAKSVALALSAVLADKMEGEISYIAKENESIFNIKVHLAVAKPEFPKVAEQQTA